MKQKGIAPILIIILIAVVVGGGILIYQKQLKPTSQSLVQSSPSPAPNSSETANWKTYTNNKYKFLFKYPPNWIIKPLPSAASSWELLVLLSEDAAYDTNGLGSLSNGQEISINLLTNSSSSLPTASITDQSFIPNTLSGKAQGFRRQAYGQVGAQITSEGYTYLFNCFAAGSTDPNNTGVPCKQSLNQILSTFKFIQ